MQIHGWVGIWNSSCNISALFFLPICLVTLLLLTLHSKCDASFFLFFARWIWALQLTKNTKRSCASFWSSCALCHRYWWCATAVLLWLTVICSYISSFNQEAETEGRERERAREDKASKWQESTKDTSDLFPPSFPGRAHAQLMYSQSYFLFCTDISNTIYHIQQGTKMCIDMYIP